MTHGQSVPTPEEVWRQYDAAEQRLSAQLSERMLDLARLRPGMHVLDLATGRGEPAVRAAHRVAPSGSVLGVDLSAGMLAMARERAAREGVTNLELRVASAESLEGVPIAHYHATLARWALMYLDSPLAALQAAHRAMVPGGVLVAAVWAEPECVPYFTLPRRVLGNYLLLPQVDQDAPGTFRYAAAGRLERDLGTAGFEVLHTEQIEVPVMEAQTADELIAWARAFGMARLLEDLPMELQKAWEEDFVREAESLREGGFIRLGGLTRVVQARRLDS
jgi:ubiquinone/menaquinone biosynthesis C-methylase UbiE